MLTQLKKISILPSNKEFFEANAKTEMTLKNSKSRWKCKQMKLINGFKL